MLIQQPEKYKTTIKYWNPRSGEIRGWERSELFHLGDKVIWSTFIVLPARHRRVFFVAEVEPKNNAIITPKRFSHIIHMDNGDSAIWTAIFKNASLEWSFKYKTIIENGRLHVEQDNMCFYSVHSLALDSQLGRFFSLTWRESYVPTVSIPVLPESVEDGEPPVYFHYYHVIEDEPPNEAMEYAAAAFKSIQTPLWLRVTEATHKDEKPDYADSVWQMYDAKQNPLVLLFCYVPQYPSCYINVSSQR